MVYVGRILLQNQDFRGSRCGFSPFLPGEKRLFLVADPFFVKNGTAKRIVELSRCESSEIFDKIQPDPTVALAAEGTARLRAFAPDLLVALGGGCTLDCAKAMA